MSHYQPPFSITPAILNLVVEIGELFQAHRGFDRLHNGQALKDIAVRFQPDDSVNCVTPAAARTPIFDQMSPQHIDYMLSKIPMKRFLEPREAASLVAWLASEDCAFSTGAVFDLSGGRATY